MPLQTAQDSSKVVVTNALDQDAAGMALPGLSPLAKQRLEILHVEGHHDTPCAGRKFEYLWIAKRGGRRVFIDGQNIVSLGAQGPANMAGRQVSVKQDAQRQLSASKYSTRMNGNCSRRSSTGRRFSAMGSSISAGYSR